MNIEEILLEWEKDAEIDDTHLDKSSIATSSLHAKYLNVLIRNKLKLSKFENDYKILRQKKFRYYRGELTKEELLEYGWSQWQGIRPTKSEMDEFLDGDEDLNKMFLKIEYLNSAILLIDSIMSQLKSRDFQISNAVKWKMFISGS